MECGSEEKPRGTALQSVLGSKHQESCVSSSSVLTAASQKLPAERNQEICQARSAVRVVCTSQHCVRRTSKEKEGWMILHHHINSSTTGWGGQASEKGAHCRIVTDGWQTEALKHHHGLGTHSYHVPCYLPACLLPYPPVCTPLPQLPCFCTWRMGSGIRYLQQDWTRRTAVSRLTLWPTEI